MSKKKLLLMLIFVMVILFSSCIYFVLNRKVKITVDELYSITEKLNSDEYRLFFSEVFRTPNEIDIRNVINSEVLYDKIEEDVNKVYEIELDKFNNYLLKYTKLNISDFDISINDEISEDGKFLYHIYNPIFTNNFDCLEGYYKKAEYNLNCAKDGKLYNIKMTKLNDDFILQKYIEK